MWNRYHRTCLPLFLCSCSFPLSLFRTFLVDALCHSHVSDHCTSLFFLFFSHQRQSSHQPSRTAFFRLSGSFVPLIQVCLPIGCLPHFAHDFPLFLQALIRPLYPPSTCDHDQDHLPSLFEDANRLSAYVLFVVVWLSMRSHFARNVCARQTKQPSQSTFTRLHYPTSLDALVNALFGPGPLSHFPFPLIFFCPMQPYHAFLILYLDKNRLTDSDSPRSSWMRSFFLPSCRQRVVKKL